MPGRSISTMPSTGTGSSISLPFPDLSLPESGEWTLEVTLSKTTSEPTAALIEFIQSDTAGGSKLLGSEKVILSGTPTVYPVSLSGPGEYMSGHGGSPARVGLLSSEPDPSNDPVYGRCHVSELVLQVTEVAVPCCCRDLAGESPFEGTYSLEMRDLSDNVIATADVTYNGGTGWFESDPFTAVGCDVEKVRFRCVDSFCMWEGLIYYVGDPVGYALLRLATSCDPFFHQWRIEGGCLTNSYFYVT